MDRICDEPDCENEATKTWNHLHLCKDCYVKYFECEEPKCTKRATKDWNGRKVCDDHYDKYRDAQEEVYWTLDS